MSSVIDSISSMNFLDLVMIIVDAQYYEFFFPFMLLFALYYHVLFRIVSRNGNLVLSKAMAIIVALTVSFYSITFKFSSGYSLADFMILLFPNISAISIMILGLYVVGSVLGVDFFKGMFRKDVNSYTVIALGVVAFGSVVYYAGIVMGFWEYDPYSTSSYASIVLSVGLFILGAVFLLIGWLIPAIFVLLVSILLFTNAGDTSTVDMLFDPFLFIIFIVIAFMNWISKDPGKELYNARVNVVNTQRTLDEIKRANKGRRLRQGDHLLYDINSQILEDNKKKVEKLSKRE